MTPRQRHLLREATVRMLRKAKADRRRRNTQALECWLNDHADILGITLPKLETDGRPSRMDAETSLAFLAATARVIDRTLSQTAAPKPSLIEKHVAALGQALKLNALETRILTAAVNVATIPQLHSLAEIIGNMPTDDEVDFTALHILANTDARQLREALHKNGLLRSLQLIEDRGGNDWAPSQVVVDLARSKKWDTKPDQLIRALYGRPPKCQLQWSEFEHVKNIDLAARLLKAAVANRESGVSVLLFGEPGQGKTQLALALAERIGAIPVLVGEKEDSGEPSRGSRVTSYAIASAAAQRTGGTLLIVDECEEITQGLDEKTPFSRSENGSRLYINRLVENCAPTVWITNYEERIPVSVRDRISLGVPVPKLSGPARKKMVEQIAQNRGLKRISEATVCELASLDNASPRAIDTATRVAKLTNNPSDAIIVARSNIKLTSGRESNKMVSPTVFDPSLSSADCDLVALAQRIGSAKSCAVTMALTGVPGAGKSAYARHIAEMMSCDVIEKRSSDIFNMYLGGTEKRIAQAFQEAADRKAMLIFDEADSFLQERGKADKSWEVSTVNEFLQALEKVSNHPVVLTTNAPIASLDQALSRRILFKVNFLPMTAEQARTLWRRSFNSEAPKGIERLALLTPGDFAVIKRQLAYLGELTPPELMLRLEAEVAAKSGAARRIGF